MSPFLLIKISKLHPHKVFTLHLEDVIALARSCSDMYLKDRTSSDYRCYPAIGTIARELKLSQSIVKRAIDDLERSGYLRKEQHWRENGGKSSNMFYLKKSDS